MSIWLPSMGLIFLIKRGVTELKDILLNNMPNIWYNQAYVKGFYCGYILFKKASNMFEKMEIAGYI